MIWIKNYYIVLFSTLIALVISEIFLRIIDIVYNNSPLERSSSYHHVNPSDYHFLMYDPYEENGGHYVYYDNLGFREHTKTSSTTQKASEEKAIIFLGDSFTLGNQTPYSVRS